MSESLSIPMELLTCDYCGEQVPVGHFCGACGAHLTHVHPGSRARDRWHSFAAFPDQSVVQFSFVTSLFPHLAHLGRRGMRVTFALLWVLLGALVVAHLATAIYAVSALGFTALFLLYVAETGSFEKNVASGVATVLVGLVLGVVFGLVAGPIETRSAITFLPQPISSGSTLVGAVVIPVVAQLAMALPLVIMWRQRHRLHESLDGFVVGAAGALGFTTAMTIVNLWPQLRNGVVAHGDFIVIMSNAVIRGFTVPVTSAALTGLIGLTLWARRRDRDTTAVGYRVLTQPVVWVLLALGLQVGLGYADLAQLPTPLVLALHVAVVLIAILALRAGLHFSLLHESHEFVIGPPRACPTCHHVTPTMPFCAQCGVAEYATPKHHRHRERRLNEAPTPEEVPS